MTRNHRLWFLVLVPIGAAGLALGTAASASASTAWGGPEPTPTPTVVYTPPPMHHNGPVCELSLLTEHDTVADPRGADEGDQYGQQPYGQPSYDPAGAPSSAPVYGYPDHQRQTDTVEVVQLVKLCVFEGEHGRPDQVKVWDVTQPFAWVSEDHGEQFAPSPSGYPSALAPFLHK